MMDAPTQRRGPRIGLWIAGLVLWMAAFAGLFFVWQQSRAGSATATARKPAAIPLDAPQAKPAAADGPGTLRSAWDKSVADFSLTERSGRTVTNEDLLGKPWIVNFIFTRCSYTCPILTSSMVRLQEKLEGVDVRLVTITVDPRHDTPQVLREYASRFAADPEKWLFLTGEQDTIHRLINESFLLTAAESPEPVSGYEFAHSNNILLVDAQGKVVDKFLGTDDAAMSKLVRVVKKLAADSPPPRARRNPVSEGDRVSEAVAAPHPADDAEGR